MVTVAQKKALVEAACAAREKAYAPYSHYSVGAAVLTEDGRIVSGANVENAAYGSSMCAERAAVFTAVSQGVRALLAVAVCTANGGSPCGSCRQVLAEFGGDIPVLISDSNGLARETTLHALLPDHFGPQHLV